MAEAFGIASGAIGLAATVFQTAKGIRDLIHTVSSSPWSSKITMLTPPACLQAMSEKQEILDLLQENQEEMDLLAGLYNEHKEHLDQTKLTHDLERLRVYVSLRRAHFACTLTTTP